MSCDDFAAKVGAYIDAELSPEEMRLVGEHARRCPACATKGLEIVAGKRAVKVSGLKYVPSPDFRRKVREQVSSEQSGRLRTWLIPLVAIAACMIIAAALMLRASSQVRNERIREVADLHVSALASTSPVDVVSTDRHTVKPWFQGKLPFSFELPDPATVPYPLLGGKVTYLAQSPAAQLIYQVHQHRVSVFITQERQGDSLGGRSIESSQTSFRVESWAQSGLRYFVVGDVGWEDIHRVAAAMKKAAASS